jgi:hypothetical protein
MIKRLFIVMALLTFGYNYAQDGTASPYSYYGLGELRFKGTIENQTMGGISMFADSIHINLQNPAAYAKLGFGDIRMVTYTAGLTHSATQFNTTDAHQTTNITSFDYLSVGMSLSKKLGMGFGVLPFTSEGYRLESFSNTTAGNILTKYSGDGGINRVYLSFGYALTNELSIGITGNYDFGKQTNETLIGAEGVQLATQEDTSSDISGIDFNLALNYQTKIGKGLELFTTLQYSPEATLTSKNERTLSTIQVLSNGVLVPRDVFEVDLASQGLAETDVTLPMSATIGLGVGKENKWFLGTEYKFKEISKFDNPIFSNQNVTYNDAYTLSAGGFWIPQHNAFNNYWKRVTYRAGVRFDQTGLEIQNEAINQFGIHFGLGLPVAGFSNINLGFEVGRQGTSEKNLVRENYFKARISLSFNDRWFAKKKFN